MTRASLISLFVGLCSIAHAAPKPGGVVATINDKKITVEDFNKRYMEVKTKTLNPPPPEVFLEELVRFEMGVMEAEKKNMRKDPIVAERIDEELYKGLVERALAKDVSEIKVTDKEMEEYYKKNPELRSSHILIEFRPDAKPEEKQAAYKRAKEIYDEVRKSKRPFEELVGLYTDDVLTKKNGGDVGWQSRLTLVPNVYDTLLEMKVNEIRGIVETQFGYHILKLTGRNPYSQANKREIRMAVFNERRKILFDRFFAGLKKNYHIKTNPGILK